MDLARITKKGLFHHDFKSWYLGYLASLPKFQKSLLFWDDEVKSAQLEEKGHKIRFFALGRWEGLYKINASIVFLT